MGFLAIGFGINARERPAFWTGWGIPTALAIGGWLADDHDLFVRTLASCATLVGWFWMIIAYAGDYDRNYIQPRMWVIWPMIGSLAAISILAYVI